MGASPQPPLVSVVLPARDAGGYLGPAVRSILEQTLTDLELIVVDDGSRDATPALLGAVEDARLRVVRSEASEGLAAALNRGLDLARGTYLARMDADDVALPNRLERQVAFLRSAPGVAVVGTAVVELSGKDDVGRVHLVPGGREVTRWRTLFGTPFFHPSVLLDRAVLERHGLRYDPAYVVAQDYRLWSRLLDVADGDNLPEPLVLYRAHAAQASAQRATLQVDHRRELALARILAVAPGLGEDGAELAWLAGDARPVPSGRETEAATALLDLLDATGAGRDVRHLAARSLARLAVGTRGRGAADVARGALRLDPALPLTVGRLRARERAARRAVLPVARATLRAAALDHRPVRVTVVSPEPTPYRAPLFDRLDARPELDLRVVFAAETVAARTWDVGHHHPATTLRGVSVPGARQILRHDYPVTPGVGRALAAGRPDVVVVSGWSTYAAKAAIRWSRRHHVPYLLLVESHDRDPRAAWRRAVKGAIVPHIVRGAAGILATGTLVRESMVARGADPARIHVFANTVDVEEFAARADALRPRREELRAALGVAPDDVVVLCVARLVAEKGLDTLLRAAAAAGTRVVPVLAGEGPERAALERLSAELGLRVVLLGDVAWERIVEGYVAADVFALVSRHEPWGVVVNEAIACGLPLVLSEHVGAAPDLLEDGHNGSLVPVDDVAATAAALGRWAADAQARAAAGARSREIAAGWGYGPSVEGFVRAVLDAVGR